MPLLFRFLLFLLCLGCAGVLKAEEKAQFETAPAAPWVRAIPRPEAPATPPQGNGIDYRLVDCQELVEPRASYYHEVRSIYSENGVRNGSDVTVSFDPTYQKLILHALNVIRDNVVTNRLDRSQIKVFQRESEMELFLYDGSYTAQCQLEDIRVGDVIEFSYTVEGANPVMAGHYTDSFATNWSTPVQHAFTRIVYPANRKLHFKTRNKEIQPRITSDAGITEWIWEEKAIPTQVAETTLPTGYGVFGAVHVSDFASWTDVVKWALPLYDTKPVVTAELQAQVEKLKSIPDEDQRVLAALRFVQEDIRYLGIEIGTGSHQPTAPGEVLRRRFGDCKDKTQLLQTLLRAVDIDAAAALVSTDLGKETATRLPSTAVFNHVILRVATSSGIHWLDATRTQQRGVLSEIPVGRFEFALVIRPNETALTPFTPPAASASKTTVVENYQVGRPGEDSFLDVTTEYRGSGAESNRRYHKEHVPAELDQQYLKYYAKTYPGIQLARPHEFQEEHNGGGCLITEHYRIPQIWILNDAKSKYSLPLYPKDLNNAMGETVSPQREHPLEIAYPVDITHELNAEMFEDWPVTLPNQKVANNFFRFEEKVNSGGRNIRVAASFQTLTDRVPVPDVAAYNAAVEKIRDSLGYTLSYSTPEQLAAEKLRNPPPKTATLFLVTAGVVIASSTWRPGRT